jgi:hypothetical protein
MGLGGKEKIRGVWVLRKSLVENGTGAYLGQCKLCSRNDLVFPASQFTLCPRCAKGSALTLDDIYLVKSGYCDVCGCHFIGAGMIVRSGKMLCFRCLWGKLGKHKGALRPDGYRIL